MSTSSSKEQYQKASTRMTFEVTLRVGQYVQKMDGYEFFGVIIGINYKTDGNKLIVVESLLPGSRGMTHIFRPHQLDQWNGDIEGTVKELMQTLETHEEQGDLL